MKLQSVTLCGCQTGHRGAYARLVAVFPEDNWERCMSDWNPASESPFVPRRHFFKNFLLQSRPVSSQSGWIKGSSTVKTKTSSSPPAIISGWRGGELHLGPADGTWLNSGGDWGLSARWFRCCGAPLPLPPPPPSQALGSISWKQVIQREPLQASLAFVLM